MKFYILCFSFITSILISQARAEQMLPIFSGFWYTDISSSIPGNHLTACLKEEYSYKNHLPGTAEQVASTLLSSPRERTDCNWEPAELFESQKNFPPDFIFQNQKTLSEWQSMINNGQPTSQIWNRNCVTTDKNGSRHILDSISITIHPQYICPQNATYGVDINNLESGAGCTTQPAPCFADVAGRELNRPFPVSALGHVGLTTGLVKDPAKNQYAIQVIEVLDADDTGNKAGIYIHDHDASFVHNQNLKYWGTKYGVNGQSLLDIQAYQILGAAASQMQFPFEYTRGWDWHPGAYANYQIFNTATQTWTHQIGITPAKFRCDSFVYYAYSMAGKFILPKYKKFITPLDIFNALNDCRNSDGSYCKPTSNPSSLSILQKNDSQAFLFLIAAPSTDLHSLDQSSYDYIHSPLVSRSQKLYQLLLLLETHINNKEKTEYIIDLLNTLKPIEILPEIITLFSQNSNAWFQEKMMLLLLSTLSAKTNEETIRLTAYVDSLKKGLSFIKSQLMSSQNQELKQIILNQYLNLFSRESLIQTLIQLKKQAGFSMPKTETDRIMIHLALLAPNPSLRALTDTKTNRPLFLKKICQTVQAYPLQTLSVKHKDEITTLLKEFIKIKTLSPKKEWTSCHPNEALNRLSVSTPGQPTS